MHDLSLILSYLLFADGSFRDVSAIRNIAASLPIGVPMFPKGSFSDQTEPKPLVS